MNNMIANSIVGASRCLEQAIDVDLNEHGLSYKQFVILDVVDRLGQVRSEELSDLVWFTYSEKLVVEYLLLQDGCLQPSKSDPNDEAEVLSCTVYGRLILSRCRPIIEKTESKLIQAIGPQASDIFWGTLAALVEHAASVQGPDNEVLPSCH